MTDPLSLAQAATLGAAALREESQAFRFEHHRFEQGFRDAAARLGHRNYTKLQAAAKLLKSYAEGELYATASQ